MNKFEVWAMNLPYRKWMIERVTDQHYREFFKELHRKKVLEIGCGHGLGARIIKKYFLPKKIVATDLDPIMIASATKHIHDPTIVFETADATKLPYDDNGFDAVFVYGALHHIPGPFWKDSVHEIYRVLTRKGKAFIYDNSIESFQSFWGRINRIISVHPYDSMYTKGELVNECKSIGFKIRKEVNLGRYFAIIAEK